MRAKPATKKNIASGIICTAPWRLTKVRPHSNYTLEVEFIDGTHGVVEMSELVKSNKAGVFTVLKDLNLFNQVCIQHGAITWPGEIDLAPDAIHDAIKRYGECV
ncbi:hypothetical protein M569_17032, partial [Genlisea aurea]